MGGAPIQDYRDVRYVTVARPQEGAMSWLDALWGERAEEPGDSMTAHGVIGLVLIEIFILLLLVVEIPRVI